MKAKLLNFFGHLGHVGDAPGYHQAIGLRQARLDFLQKAPYRIEAWFDGLETISLKVNGRAALRQRWNGAGELKFFIPGSMIQR